MLTGERCRTIVTYRALQQTRLVPYWSLGAENFNKQSSGVRAAHGFAFSDAKLQALVLFRPGAATTLIPLSTASPKQTTLPGAARLITARRTRATQIKP